MNNLSHPKVELKIKILEGNLNGCPKYGSELASGFDLQAAQTETLYPGETKIIKTGISVQIPIGYELQIRSRSGLASKGIIVNNSPGTIDADYTGEICIIAHNNNHVNHVDVPFSVTYGMKIAQAVLCPVVRAEFKLVEELDTTKRGEGGFGSTGL